MREKLVRIKRAIVSVSDKTGILEFCRVLAAFEVEIFSTGGTAQKLREAGIPVHDISEITGFPEILDGRVKTLHPKVHGGLLYVRDNHEHCAVVGEHGIEPIDMVVVNLYPFEKTAAKPDVTLGQLIENIDIGGPAMTRSAAKNFEDVAVVTSLGQYDEILNELRANKGSLTLLTRWTLAQQAFAFTGVYDSVIASTLQTLHPDFSLQEA